MFDSKSLNDIWEQFLSWFHMFFWNENTLYQGVIIIWAFIFAAIAYRYGRSHITNMIESAEMPIRIKRSLNNIKRLVFPLLALVFIFLGTLIASSETFSVNVNISYGVMKVLAAWIVIRIALQIIENAALRNFFALTIWITAALSIFGILDETTEALDAIGFSIGEFKLTALVVIKTVLSLFILLYLAGFISTFFERQVLRSQSLTRSSQVLISKIIRISLIVIAILIGVTSAGVDLSIFTVFSGAVGLGVGFGLQKVASNLFSGLLLLMDKSITPGDVIEIENSQTFGWVNHMGARYTEIITRSNKSFLIPNEDFITQRVVNWSHGNKLIRLETSFGVHYNSDPHKVIEVAIDAATKPARVVEKPSPKCWLLEFGDSSLNFTLRFWIKDAESGVSNITGEVLLALWDAFKEHGIEIPYPHREVFIHKTPDSHSPVLPEKPQAA